MDLPDLPTLGVDSFPRVSNISLSCSVSSSWYSNAICDLDIGFSVKIWDLQSNVLDLKLVIQNSKNQVCLISQFSTLYLSGIYNSTNSTSDYGSKPDLSIV